MTGTPPLLKIKLQIYCGDEIAMGPGKADLLDAIVAEGSISGAARALGMSYRRAWLLVDAMNRCWCELLVETAPGRAVRGGARLTPLGEEVLRLYRSLQEQAGQLRSGEVLTTLRGRIRAAPREHQKR